MKLLTLGLLFGAIAISADSANATVVRNAKDSRGNVTIRGFAPNAEFNVVFEDKILASEIKANSCGHLLIPKSLIKPDTTFSVSNLDNSSRIDFSVFNFFRFNGLIVPPDCFNGVSSNVELRTAFFTDYKTADGRAFFNKRVPNRTYLVYGRGENTRKVKTNACGMLTFRSSVAFPVTGVIRVFSTEGNPVSTNFDVETMPVEAPPICRNGIEYEARNPSDPNIFKAISNGVFLVGGVPSSSVKIDLLYTNIKRRLLSDSCGMVRARNNPRNPFQGSIFIKDFSGNQILDTSNTGDVNSAPRCVNGSIVVDSNGFGNTSYRLEEDYYFVGLQPQTLYSLEYEGTLSRQVRINACGFGRFRSSDRFPITTNDEIRINGGGTNTSGFRNIAGAFCRGNILYTPRPIPTNPGFQGLG